jgi:hypothetical protein
VVALVFPRGLITVWAACLAGAVASLGCGSGVTKRACMGGSAPSPLVTDAAMVRLDVYGANAHCVDGQLAAGAGAPVQSQTFAQGQPIKLDVPPGPHAIVLSTFADADGMQLLGIGCTEADLSAGAQICFDLTIEPAPDGGDDLSGAVCSTSPNDDCPTGQYCNGLACVPGCKSDGDCPATDAGSGVCDTTTHTCENCVADKDCGSAPGAACCNKHCTNVKSDPLNCNGCGMACTGANTQCCNAACSNPNSDANNCGACGQACSTLNAMSASCGGATCSWTCNAGYAHCAAGNTGCETNLGSAGKKLCGNVCVSSSSCCSAGDCMSPPAPVACYLTAGSCSGVGGTCNYTLKSGSKVCGTTCCNAVNGTCNVNCTLTCTSGYADCDGDPSNGCETNLASAGKKLCAGACIAVATCCTSADCTTPPAPAACYATQGSCPGAGGTCNYTENSGSQICSTTCCNADHGTCNAGSCTLNCAGGYFDCNGTPTDGCETACAPAHATGGCSGGNCAIGTCTSGFFDCNSSVSDGCECGTSCCTNPITSMPGCTVTGHTDGFGHAFSDCIPVATVGNNATYSSQLALDAANADTSQNGTASDGWTCTDSMNNVTSKQICKTTGDGSTGTCTCWTYYGINGDAGTAGHVYNSSGGSGDKGCFCPTTAANSWQ